MTYLPFARKWRPQEFDLVIGQEHITTTLKNAISLNRVHHAYLFAGPRGIGKTSTARIFSKALNCEKGPTPTPCNKCASCLEITSGASLDVIEIDGASNNGVDEIRNLRETVKFSASKGRYKIYIIDEVHMLTMPAFNALLKTLEEPPQHVKFIFATTEPHKLPTTILSRCQRFDFRRISIKEIVATLKEISKKEKLDIEEGVFLYIAKASDGSMRDAESVLDQVASFSKGKVRLKDIIESLGMIEEELLFRCTDLIVKKDTKDSIHLVAEVLNSGKDPKQFLLEMLEHFRNIMIVKSGVVSEDIIDLPKEAIEKVKKQSESLSHGDIFYVISVISNGLKMVKQFLPERIALELCMIKLTTRDSIVSIEEMLSKLPEITESLKSAPPNTAQQNFSKNIHESVKKAMNPTKQENMVSHSGIKSTVDIARVKNAWPILVKAMAVKKMSLSSYLAEGAPDYTKGDTIFVGFPKELNFHREVLEEKHNKPSIEAALSQILDTPIKLQFILTERTLEESREPESSTLLTKDELKKKEPVIDSALNIFGGKILRARNA
ncbi:DNA polymerase III subunit gamma/tau [Candidatus Omnitrophota bacterium]